MQRLRQRYMINSADSVIEKLTSGKERERAVGNSKVAQALEQFARIISLYKQNPSYEQISEDFVID